MTTGEGSARPVSYHHLTLPVFIETIETWPGSFMATTNCGARDRSRETRRSPCRCACARGRARSACRGRRRGRTGSRRRRPLLPDDRGKLEQGLHVAIPHDPERWTQADSGVSPASAPESRRTSATAGHAATAGRCCFRRPRAEVAPCARCNGGPIHGRAHVPPSTASRATPRAFDRVELPAMSTTASRTRRPVSPSTTRTIIWGSSSAVTVGECAAAEAEAGSASPRPNPLRSRRTWQARRMRVRGGAARTRPSRFGSGYPSLEGRSDTIAHVTPSRLIPIVGLGAGTHASLFSTRFDPRTSTTRRRSSTTIRNVRATRSSAFRSSPPPTAWKAFSTTAYGTRSPASAERPTASRVGACSSACVTPASSCRPSRTQRRASLRTPRSAPARRSSRTPS